MDLPVTKKELLKQSVKSLKRKSKTLKLSSQGSKMEIIDRIIAYNKNNPSAHRSSAPIISNSRHSSKDKKALLSARLRYTYKYKGPKRKPLVTFLGKSKSELLLYGYVRSLEKRKRIFIPEDVVMMFVSYHYLRLPPYKLSRNNFCFVDTDNQILTTQRNNRGRLQYTYIIFDTPWKGSKHELTLQCIKHNKKEIGIGIITNKNAHQMIQYDRVWLFGDAKAGLTYQMILNNGRNTKIYCTDFGHTRYSKTVNKCVSDGMIISMKVDLWERKIKFYLDEEQIDEFSVGVGTFYPAITYECSRMEPFDLQYRLLLCD